jgi:hypothetical protein
VHAPKIRTIFYDERFERELEYIQPHARRADEFINGAENVLARDPEAGFPLEDNSQVWVICGHTVNAVLYYTFDENNVYFLSIEKTMLPEL